MKKLAITISAFLCAVFCAAQTTMSIAETSAGIDSWIVQHFARGTVPPFSFKYGGRPSEEFITQWAYTSEKKSSSPESNAVDYVFTYSNAATGLKVICNVRGYTDFSAVEWVVNFTNTGKSKTLQISDLNSADINFSTQETGKFKLHYAEGSTASKSDFSQHLKVLEQGDGMHFRPNGGRSSDGAFPFFNIEMPSSQGVITAIGWTGTWVADVNRVSDHNVRLVTGFDWLDTYLYPAESMRSSRVCLLFWHGDNFITGQNTFRRFVLAHHTARVNGKPAVYPLCAGFNYGDPAPCNEYSCLTEDYAIAMMRRYKQFNLLPEAFWLDAGWYKDAGDVANGKDWYNTAGNWIPDKERFPHGLKPLSKEAHKLGCKFMVWFEPERVHKGTIWYEEHHDWLINDCLFNLGNEKALKWLCKYMGNFMQRNGIDYYRQDFNIAPESHWASCDSAGRRGITQMRYIEGLYKYWDYLLKRFPEAIIDNCASGGRRIDLETISRSAPLWRTDYNYGEPVGYQCHTYGLEFYLPNHGTGLMRLDKFSYRSSFGSAMVNSLKITDRNFPIPAEQALLKEVKEVRPYFLEDYYPLSGIDSITSNSIWLAYQLHRPKDDSGYIVAFRRKDNKDSTYVVKLCGLNPDKEYTLVNKDTKVEVRKSGLELANGFQLKLSMPESSLLIFYSTGAALHAQVADADGKKP